MPTHWLISYYEYDNTFTHQPTDLRESEWEVIGCDIKGGTEYPIHATVIAAEEWDEALSIARVSL